MTSSPAARYEVLQVFSRGVEFMGQSLQIFRLQTIVLTANTWNGYRTKMDLIEKKSNRHNVSFTTD